ncbi:MAG TPA: MauE/DoxX family redox-associated membrane protein [Ktedonobacteraceae bacterium]
MLAASLVMFCRITIALLLLYSGGSKLLSWRDFAVTIGDFKLFPRRLSKPVAYLFVASEFMTMILAVIGGVVLPAAFLLAMLLLVGFSSALASALWRKLDLHCNCFGRTERRISSYDLIRNLLLIVCSLTGLCLAGFATTNLSVGEIILLALMSAVLLLIVIQLRDIVETLWHSFPVPGERI